MQRPLRTLCSQEETWLRTTSVRREEGAYKTCLSPMRTMVMGTRPFSRCQGGSLRSMRTHQHPSPLESRAPERRSRGEASALPGC